MTSSTWGNQWTSDFTWSGADTLAEGVKWDGWFDQPTLLDYDKDIRWQSNSRRTGWVIPPLAASFTIGAGQATTPSQRW